MYLQLMYLECSTVAMCTAVVPSLLYKGKYHKDVKIGYYDIVKGKHRRKMSIFQVGYTLFKLARDSLRYIRIPFNFVLTDV